MVVHEPHIALLEIHEHGEFIGQGLEKVQRLGLFRERRHRKSPRGLDITPDKLTRQLPSCQAKTGAV